MTKEVNMEEHADNQKVHQEGGTPIDAFEVGDLMANPSKNAPKKSIQKPTPKKFPKKSDPKNPPENKDPENTHKYVAYYRVSSKQQGQSGLGLEAQQTEVLAYIRRNGNKIIAEYTEVESGRKSDRPQLQLAIETAKEHNATLVVAKLDRLTRNVHFLTTLMESKVRFVCCDMPDATNLTIHIFAAIAEWELGRISTRTKEGLQAKRIREPDWQPGTDNFTDEGRAKSKTKIRDNANTSQANRHAFHFISPRRVDGMSYAKIAQELNAEGYRTRGNKPFHAQQVMNIWKRFTEDETETQTRTNRINYLRLRIDQLADQMYTHQTTEGAEEIETLAEELKSLTRTPNKNK